MYFSDYARCTVFPPLPDVKPYIRCIALLIQTSKQQSAWEQTEICLYNRRGQVSCQSLLRLAWVDGIRFVVPPLSPRLHRCHHRETVSFGIPRPRSTLTAFFQIFIMPMAIPLSKSMCHCFLPSSKDRPTIIAIG